MTDAEQKDELRKRLFVAVHAGAGFHSQEKASEYKRLCKKACLQAMSVLTKKESAVDAVTAAISTLEDSELTNAGRGSSLTMSGTVECDACVMEGKTSLFGGVGCLSGALNPIKVAAHLLQMQQQSSLSLGRIPPSILAGKGAREWAQQHGFACDFDSKLVTDRSRRMHLKYKRKVERAEKEKNAKRFRHSKSDKGLSGFGCEKTAVQDTVGAFCIDWEGNISSAVSSGGIWLKQPGRLGPAAMYGCACWAQNSEESQPGLAVIASGCGEHLMRTLLAKTCADSLRSEGAASEGLKVFFKEHFLESKLLSGVESRQAGAVAIITTATDKGVPNIDVCWGHTTESMALGYMSGVSKSPKTIISRLNEGCVPGQSFAMAGDFFSHSDT